ncbi:MAG: HEAT repeat domain-containing protein [Elusimicrobia bacterium]|nr:HEAT repeat domain-containing protein [Elusimicrobiota bacterium]
MAGPLPGEFTHSLWPVLVIAFFMAGPLPAATLAAQAGLGAQEISNRDLGRKALETAVTYVKSPDSDIRALAAGVLGRTGNKAAAGLLKKLLADPDKHTRIAAAESLWKLGETGGLRIIYSIINDVPAQGPVGNTALVELKIISQNKIREHAIEAYARIKGEKASEFLFKLKNDAYGSIRDVAARELSRLGYSGEMAQFLYALESEDEAIRYASVKVFARICNSRAVKPLGALLMKETSSRVKIAALDALKCMDARKDAIAELLKLADDANPSIRFKAVGVLSAIRNKKAFEKLKEIYGETTDLNLKIAMLKGLMSGGQAPDKDLLDRAFASANPDVKTEALKVLESMAEAEVKPYLRDALSDSSVNVRLAAALQILKRFARQQTQSGKGQ